MSSDPSIRLKGNYFGDPEYFCTDVTKGVTRTPTGTRICTLPSEFLLGLRDAVIYECGRSYRPVLKAAGRRWGSQFIKRLERELSGFYQTPFKELSPGLIRVCLDDAFNYHGYGRLSYTVLPENGDYIVAEVTDSVMPALVRESDRPVDLLISGLLAAIFSHLSGKTLDAVQTECPTMGSDRCRFLVGPAAHIAEITAWLDEASSMPSHEEIVRQAMTGPSDQGQATNTGSRPKAKSPEGGR